jgi:arylsulfatase A-like enzyme
LLALVSDNTDQSVQQNRHRSAVRYAIRHLTAELLRVAAGAGNEERFFAWFNNFAAACNQSEAAGFDVEPGAIRDALDPMTAKREHRPWIDYQKLPLSEQQIDRAQQEVLRHALRMFAAQMDDKLTQESTAQGKMHDAETRLRELVAARYAEALG